MSNITKDNELLDFIVKKKLEPNPNDSKKVFFLFVKIMRNALVSSYSKLNNLNYSISCSEMIFSIFWIIYSQTFNPKLTMFLSERAVVLFSEYVSLSNNMESNPVNLMDVKLFIYKKTLGPLKLFGSQPYKDFNTFNLASKFKDLMQEIFKVTHKLNNYDDHLEIFCTSFSNVCFKLDKLSKFSYIDNNFNLNTITNENFYKILIDIKVDLEMYCYIIDNYESPYTTEKYKFLYKSINFPESLYKTELFKLKDTPFYKTLLNNMESKFT